MNMVTESQSIQANQFCAEHGACQERISQGAKEIEELKRDVKEIKNDVTNLKQDNAETKVYVKQIFERIDDLKVLFKQGNDSTNSLWSKIVLELIKSIGIIAGIIAGIKLLG